MFKENVRPIAFLICTVTLCILAVAESVGAANPPAWALGVLIPIVGGLAIERGIRKSKGVE
jgi:hypothetical protein